MYVIPMVSLMAPLHSLGQENQNYVQHDFLGHVIILVPVSMSDQTDGIINITTGFLVSKQSNEIEVQHDFFGHLMSFAPVSESHDSIIHDAIAILNSGCSK